MPGREGNKRLVNFRLPPEEAETLKTLAYITEMSQADVICNLIRMEGLKQKDAIDAYKRSMKAVKDKIKK